MAGRSAIPIGSILYRFAFICFCSTGFTWTLSRCVPAAGSHHLDGSRRQAKLFRCCRFAIAVVVAVLFANRAYRHLRRATNVWSASRPCCCRFFRFHGIYIAALTRLQRFLSVHSLYFACSRACTCGPCHPANSAGFYAAAASSPSSARSTDRSRLGTNQSMPELLAYAACAFFLGRLVACAEPGRNR